jgi:hypothetical protein
VTERSNTKRILVTGLTLFGCLLIFFFGLRAVHAFRKFGGTPPPQRPSGEVETDVERIRDWMTVPFIARMYGVPEETLFDALGIPEEGNRKKSLEELNKKYYPQSDGMVEEIIKTTILTHRPPPAPDSPPVPDAPPTPSPPPAP